MLHSLFVLNVDGYMLLSKYLLPGFVNRQEFEVALMSELVPVIKILKDSKDAPSIQLFMCQDKLIIISQVGELYLLIAGNAEYDEIILGEILQLWQIILLQELDRKVTENGFLANYASLELLLDEMIQQQHWEATDVNVLIPLSKLQVAP